MIVLKSVLIIVNIVFVVTVIICLMIPVAITAAYAFANFLDWLGSKGIIGRVASGMVTIPVTAFVFAVLILGLFEG